MFASMVIRKLARSEEMFAETHNSWVWAHI